MNTTFEMTNDLEGSLIEFFRDNSFSKVFVLADKNTKKFCWPFIFNAFPPGTELLVISPGESQKTLITCEKVWGWLTKNNADRKALLVNLGGGVIGDLGGFCASVYKRGIPFIQIPTTLLAMVDSGIGGKTGIDFQQFKNQIGTFSNPLKVFVFPDFIKTIPQMELLSGFAEIIKHALISDLSSWNLLRKKELQDQPWMELIPSSLKVKQKIVNEDPFEKGERQKLNAGHTLGHALESYFLSIGNPIPHGYCVTAGLVMESRISVEKGLLSEQELVQIEELIFALYGQIIIDSKAIKKVIKNCFQDKKNTSGKVNLSLIGPIGNCNWGIQIMEEDLKLGLNYYLGKE
jgi:3-dehydroquinate synthase